MSAPNSTGLEAGYKVEPASNGGWILTDNYGFNERAKILGAFTNADDLLRHLTEEHGRWDAVKITREAEELNWQKQELDDAAEAVAWVAPIGRYRLLTFTWIISGQEKVPATQIRNEIFEDVEVARRAGIVECERGYFAFVYDDQGKLVAEVKP